MAEINDTPAPARFQILSICKGGGYRYCRTDPPHPKANSKGLYPLHRVIAENKIGRLLGPQEEVHHDNENKFDDRPENLVVLTKSEHARLHRFTPEPIHMVCPHCGSGFLVKPNDFRKRVKQNRRGILFCSRSCGSSKK